MKKETIKQVKEVYKIESECISEMEKYFDEKDFSKAVDLLINAERIGTCGCGHSGIICQHFAHLLCCVEQPARFISPAEAVHGATGFLQKDDVMVFASRGGKTKELIPILEICKKVAPMATQSFINHMNEGVNFSGEEMEALRAVLDGKPNPLEGKKLDRFNEKIRTGVQL